MKKILFIAILLTVFACTSTKPMVLAETDFWTEQFRKADSLQIAIEAEEQAAGKTVYRLPAIVVNKSDTLVIHINQGN